MKYSKEKVEAVKVLFAEILEINEELKNSGSEKEIQFEFSGGDFPGIVVHFWDFDYSQNPREVFEISLEKNDKPGRRHSIFELSEKVKDWRERFGNSQKEDGRTLQLF